MDEQDADSIIKSVVEAADNDEKNDVPESYLFIVLFYLLGTASYVQHSFYVTANEYWMYKFRNTNLPFDSTNIGKKTALQKNFTSSVGIAGNVGMIVALVILSRFLKSTSLQNRIIASMSTLLVLFAFTLIFIYVDTDFWQTRFFYIALGIGAILSACSAVLMISFFQLASRFSPRCLVALMAGQNLCGILAALVQVSALGVASSVQGTATLYYALATITIGSVMTFYMIVLKQSPEFESKLFMEHQDSGKSLKDKLDLGLVTKVLKKLALLLVSLVLSVGTTGILHPGLTTLVESAGKGSNVWSDTYFLPVCVFLLFNAFEFIGREISNYYPKLQNKYLIFSTSVARLIMLPLILMCNLQPRSQFPVVFHDDAFFITFMILLSSSGGYLANIGILVLQRYCEPEERMIGTLFVILIMIVVIPIFSFVSGAVVNLI